MTVPRPFGSDFSEEGLNRISEAVVRAESSTAGELRVHVVSGLLPFENPRFRAIRAFRELGMDQTRDATGVLLVVFLKQRRFEIVADRGIDERVPDDTWEAIASQMTEVIHEQGLVSGICHTVQQIGDVLARHVPRRTQDLDELDNEVSFDQDSKP